MGEGDREEAPKKRWAKGNTGRHFPYDMRLADTLKNPAEHACREQNSSNREDQLTGVHPMPLLQLLALAMKAATVAPFYRMDASG
jgi:hypothetical protein